MKKSSQRQAGVSYEVQKFPGIVTLLHKGKWIGLGSSLMVLMFLAAMGTESWVEKAPLILLILLLATFFAGPLYFLKGIHSWKVDAEGIRYWEGNYFQLLKGIFSQSAREANYRLIPFWQIRKIHELVGEEAFEAMPNTAFSGAGHFFFSEEKSDRPWRISLRVIDVMEPINFNFVTDYHSFSPKGLEEIRAFQYIMEHATVAIKIYAK